jgi:hypothetical protein
MAYALALDHLDAQLGDRAAAERFDADHAGYPVGK